MLVIYIDQAWDMSELVQLYSMQLDVLQLFYDPRTPSLVILRSTAYFKNDFDLSGFITTLLLM